MKQPFGKHTPAEYSQTVRKKAILHVRVIAKLGPLFRKHWNMFGLAEPFLIKLYLEIDYAQKKLDTF